MHTEQFYHIGISVFIELLPQGKVCIADVAYSLIAAWMTTCSFAAELLFNNIYLKEPFI